MPLIRSWLQRALRSFRVSRGRALRRAAARSLQDREYARLAKFNFFC